MKYLGIDFGLRRIGLALSEEGIIASPLKTIEVKGFKDALIQVSEFIQREKFDKIVVGLPEARMGTNVLAFIKALKKMGFDVITSDETLSSQKATLQMVELNIPKNKRRFNDATAAAVILQQFLDDHSNEK